VTGRIAEAWQHVIARAAGVLEVSSGVLSGRRPAQWRAVGIPVIVACVALACTTLAGCHNGPTALTDRITVTGLAERGASVTLGFERGGTVVAPASVKWSATPAAAVTITAAGVATFSDTGSVTFTGQDGTTSASLTVHVTAPPMILFDLQDSGGAGNRDVYSVALDGQGLTQLTSGTSDNEQPVLAGSTIVFTSFRDGYAALYTVPLAGGAETRIPTIPSPSDQASVSANGATLAFISTLNGSDHLWTSGIDGSNPVAATGSAGFSTAVEASPSWSTSADTLVVVTTQFGNASLAEMALSEGTETSLTNGATTDVDPAWSPDGKTIAFISTRDGDVALFTFTVATGVITRLSPNPANVADPGWLADGRIVFVSAVGSATQMRWLDPAHPDTGTVIPTPVGGDPRRPVRE
jgi:Tol biopolymer transport system component